MRIALLLGSSAGGVGTHVASLAREFGRTGQPVTVIGPQATDKQFGFSGTGGVEFIPLEVPTRLSLRDVSQVQALRAVLVRERFDIVHAHGFRAALLAVLARRGPGPGRPTVIATWHNAVLAGGLRGKLEAGIELLLARTVDLTFGASQDLVDRARDLGARNARLAPVAAPKMIDIDPSEVIAAHQRLLKELGLPDSSKLVLTVGRVAPQKNYDLLLEAARLWRSSHPDAVSIIAGGADQAELARLRRIVDRDGLPVHFIGARQDVSALYRSAEVFLLTSHWEARALVVQEAMSVGLPVIARAVGGLPELIDDAGILVRSPRREEIADAVISVLDDSALRGDLSARARRRAREFPDEAEVAAELLARYHACRDRAACELG
ncbi:glycosyltransferase family 4 protein [Saxibacter everestensis]|uniref:D-inositol 3-phosphate glycosyltransferase n=1 Tax=Saxibacter everestensis TaxID=2909229 RepID=A0ABY8QXL0_9MICO|nr:glycosyltransferase family 4 protein [Brevibacteriaceae bacterium ZFBP1038]